MTNEKKGILLVNLGTPTAPTSPAVRAYLKEFLSDPYVIDLPAIWRWLLLHTVILPFRSKRSAHAYQQIWRPTGSPLRIESEQLCQAVASALDPSLPVQLAMRYGQPSLSHGIQALVTQGCQTLRVIPLFPQYSLAATETVLTAVKRIRDQHFPHLALEFIQDFYAQPDFIAAWGAVIHDYLAGDWPERLLFSFHGLPQRQIDKLPDHARQRCDHSQPCPQITQYNANCYRAQCYATAHAIAHDLRLEQSTYAVSFQSRLGRVPWIKPYTDVLLPQLAQQGIRDLAIACPSFVVDCLETLEEIGIRARAQWQALGGQRFRLIPCLNTHPLWVKALTVLARDEALSN